MLAKAKEFTISTFRAALPFLVAVTAFFLLAIFVIRLANISANPRKYGIIALGGYEHAVVICGEEFTVNEGHIKDPQIKEIRALAIEHCPNGEKDVPQPVER